MKSVLVALLLVFPSASQAMTWGELEAEIASVEAGNAGNIAMIQRMSDIVSSLVAYHRALRESQPDAVLFCPQAGGSLDLNRVVSMVRQQANLDQATAEDSVEDMLLRALAREFPC